MKAYSAEEVERRMIDGPFRESYGPDWDRIKLAGALGPDAEFQQNYGFAVPVSVHGWQWSNTFNGWSALVTFADGWHGYTYPKR